MRIRLHGVMVMELPEYYEQCFLRIPVLQLRDGWFAFSQGFSLLHHDIALKVKRLGDIILATTGLVLLAPFMFIVALVVKGTSKGPSFYIQTRCGLSGEPFNVYKFRTMVDDAEKGGEQWSKPNDPRVTVVGKILRRTRIDELPQLWNVFIGDMSFVGPRPERPGFVKELGKQIPYYDLRHLIKPGLTGWAQVMFPYGSTVEDAKNKLEFDLYYIKNYSLALDMYIVLRTFRVVLSRSGS